MARSKLIKEREDRILNEIVVDAYDEVERAMGWYYYLQEHLATQFEARVRFEHPTSPLRVGDKVNVLGLAPEEVCEHDMFAVVRWASREFAVSMAQLHPLTSDKLILQAFADWHYWLERGNEF